MATRTDLLHSYQFRTRRVLAALVMRETDPGQSPLRRGVGAVFAGIMVTVVAAAGFGIYGLITKVGGNGWRTPGSVVVERETGATFVYLNDTLYPTLNLASAMLAGGQPNPTVHRVASKSLADVARGNTIGIPGAPDSLPTAARQIGLPWTVCAGTRVAPGQNPAASVVLAVGLPTSAGRDLADNALLVRDDEQDLTYLVWHGHRYLLRTATTAVPALFGAVTPTDVRTAWLNAIPAGVDIAPAPVNRRGQESRAMPDYDNGTVLRLEAEAGTQYYLVLDDGLAPLTRLQQVVLDAARPNDPEPVPVDASVIGAAPASAEVIEPSEVPVPSLVTPAPSDLVCATTTPDSTTPVIVTGATVNGVDQATPTPGTSPEGTPLANAILVPAGRVAVIRAVAAPESSTGSYIVVTDIGVGYPVPDASVLPMLGYSPAQATTVPASLATLIPAGPTLDPAAALTPIPLSRG